MKRTAVIAGIAVVILLLRTARHWVYEEDTAAP